MPQLAELVITSTQELPHCTRPGWHRVEHTPFEQINPGTQATPHAPQFMPSLARLTQMPPQSVSPDMQTH